MLQFSGGRRVLVAPLCRAPIKLSLTINSSGFLVNHKILYLFVPADHHQKFFCAAERGQWLNCPISPSLLFKYFPNEAAVSQSVGRLLSAIDFPQSTAYICVLQCASHPMRLLSQSGSDCCHSLGHQSSCCCSWWLTVEFSTSLAPPWAFMFIISSSSWYLSSPFSLRFLWCNSDLLHRASTFKNRVSLVAIFQLTYFLRGRSINNKQHIVIFMYTKTRVQICYLLRFLKVEKTKIVQQINKIIIRS